MRTLSRHLLSRQLFFFASALLVFFAIGAVSEILVHLDEIVEQRDAAGGVLPWLLLRVAVRYAGDAIPAAAFTGTFLCAGLAARAGETTGLNACGVSPGRSAGPLLLAAGVLSLLALVFNETWLLDARRALAGIESAGADRPASGPFWYHSGSAFYNVGERGEGGALRDVAVFELDARGRLRRSTRAESARAGARHWWLGPAALRQLDPAEPGWLRAAALAPGTRLPAVPLRPAAAGAEPMARLSLAELAERAAEPGADGLRHRVAWAARLAAPAGALACALLALPLGLRVRPGAGLAAPALLGCAGLAAGMALDAAAGLAAESGRLPVWLGAGLAPVLLGLAGLAALARRPR